MENQKDMIEKWTEALKSGNGHLYEPALSLYINFFSNLSDGEKTFCENHLKQCGDCRERFERVFDDEIDMDSNRIDISLKPEPGGYADPKNSFALQINPEELTFTSLPAEYDDQKMRIHLSDNTLRIVSARENRPIPIPGVLADHEQLLSITITVVRRGSAAAQEELKPMFVRYVRYLAAAALIIVAGGLAYEALNTHDQAQQADTQSTVPPDTMRQQTQTPEIRKDPEKKHIPEFRQSPLMADNFKPNDVLENFVNRQYRAGAAEIITPNNADTLSSPIRFKWKEMEGIHSFIVAVVDNKNEEVWRGSTESYELTCDLKFSSGLYYWMLKTDGDILSVRKFFVR
jgi:hypothetical protein